MVKEFDEMARELSLYKPDGRAIHRQVDWEDAG